MNELRDKMLLELIDVSVHYAKLPAVRSASLALGPGEVVALIGPNSAGKTSLLEAIAMRSHLRAVSGSIVFGGRDINSASTYARRKLGIRYVPDTRGVFPNLSVVENIRIGADAFGVPFKSAYSDCRELFPEVFEDRAAARGGTLSGGEQQMLALARALIGAPRLLILDEPRLGLARGVTRRLIETLSAVKGGGVSVLLADQSLGPWIDVVDFAHTLIRGSISVRHESAESLADLATSMAFD